uniref:Uncharacterized protein n=1 Tax=Castor canadensis TaxID=51338 RepID=A0A8C0W7G5_CASCN
MFVSEDEVLALREDLPENVDDLGIDADSSVSDVFFLALEFISENESCIPLGRFDKYAARSRTNCESRANGTGASHCIIFSRKLAFRILCFFKFLTTYCD